MKAFYPGKGAIALSASWKTALASVAGILLWLGLWYREAVVSMVDIWSRSDTYAHGFIILPITLWLVWRSRASLAAVTPRPTIVPAIAILLLGALWLAGDLADVLAARHYALVGMAIAGIWAAIGHRAAALVAFPLAFLLLMVPVGEFLIPGLIDRTADFTVAALRATGVPVLREGPYLQIPTGSWAVVDACSGLRYLIASITLGVLFAYLTFRRLSRRIAFVVASIIVPIIANWLRAYMIVMLGHLSGNKLAVGVDHLIYGWVFFGLVMVILFWVGSLWREDFDPVPDNAPSAAAGDVAAEVGVYSRASPAAGARAGASWVPIGACALFAVWAPLLSSQIGIGPPVDASMLVLPPAIGEWTRTGTTDPVWKPSFLPARVARAAEYRRGGKTVTVHVYYYHRQDSGSKLVSSKNTWTYDDRIVQIIGERAVRSGSAPSVREVQIKGPGYTVVARRWYWQGGVLTASDVEAKLRQAWSRLIGRGDGGAIIVLSTPYSEQTGPAVAVLDEFIGPAQAALAPILAQSAGEIRR